MVVAEGSINQIKITAIASDFDFMGASIGAAEGEAFLFAAQHAIENKQPLLVVSSGRNENARIINLIITNDPNDTCN
jgi:acetyl-CoA carboxylase carboxyl transferase subunit beta